MYHVASSPLLSPTADRKDAAMPRLSIPTAYPTAHTERPGAGMAPWVPAVRVGSRPRDMLSGARIFAGLAALVVLTRGRAA